MSYANEFLRNFRPIFYSILKEKKIPPEKAELFIIDEEPEDHSIFEPADVLDVLEQLAPDLNFLTIYTERPVYFTEYAETMYEENGLIVSIFSKCHLKNGDGKKNVYRDLRSCEVNGRPEAIPKLVLDFEWEGKCYDGQIRPGRCYIPIHKKPWEIGENLDIRVPIGYNTVIVKGIQNQRKEPEQDRFETAFYSS